MSVNYPPCGLCFDRLQCPFFKSLLHDPNIYSVGLIIFIDGDLSSLLLFVVAVLLIAVQAAMLEGHFQPVALTSLML